MLTLAACIETLFTEHAFLDRINAAAEASLSAVEFWGWRGRDSREIARRCADVNVKVVNLNIDPLVSLRDSAGIPAYVENVREACSFAERIGCRLVAAPVDNVSWGPGEPWFAYMRSESGRSEKEAMRHNVAKALKRAAPIASDMGITLLLEALNTTVDHSGYFISASSEAFDIINETGSRSVKMLFDVYHQQITEGNLISNLTANIDLIGHIHLADVPGRHEPGTGEINFSNVLKAIMDAGYQGYLGLEYVPSGGSAESIASVRRILEQLDDEQ